MPHRIVPVLFALLLLTIAPMGVSAPLSADDLLLVVNRNAPEGVELARYYAKQRGVPHGRIVELDLPTTDEISLDEYEQRIAEPLSAALRQSPLAGNVRCVVTFIGVPFRIGPRPRDAATLEELRVIGQHLRATAGPVEALAARGEALAKQIDPTFRVPGGAGIGPAERLNAAAQFAGANVASMQDPVARQRVEAAWNDLAGELTRPVELTEPASATTASTRTSELPIHPAGLNLGSPPARKALRDSARQGGVLLYQQVLAIQSDFLSFEQTDASVDNELATVLWGPHLRVRWQGNPLRFDADRTRPAPPTLMVMRLDGPGVAAVRRIIDDSIATERAGLSGRVVLDSWNKPQKRPDGNPDGYGIYDESIRRLERLLATRTKLELTFEATDQLVPENSIDGIALYCGWYDPNRVSLPGRFARGAVGFHIASYTAVGLRSQAGGWWVPALLDAGVVATIGPVNEPYLTAFPIADDFFPLLLTGRLTLAEVYWHTTPMVSWKMLAIGDPLYTPFRTNPAMAPGDLPQRLRGVVPRE